MSEFRDFPIVPADEVRDLGVMMSQYGDYNTHIEYICKKAKKRIGWISKSFNSREPHF